jgi:tetratricopeptide (TPR) repeat protein
VNPTHSLTQIAGYARSGALDHAWRIFEGDGYAMAADRGEAAALTVRGRLLKEGGRAAAEPAERRRLYGEAAEVYARAAAAPGGGTYQLINAATLSLLAGRRDLAQERAQRVLARGDADAETSYWSAATRAEALLLIGDIAAAKATLAQAVECAPHAFEDHAPTLRQFRAILDVLGEDTSWLDAWHPPRTLHFAGHLGLSPDGGGLADEIRGVLEAERIGFGYGALAAGSDIVIAEALLARGAELTVVLPVPVAPFREHSVACFGADWGARFDAILEREPRVHVVCGGANTLSPAAIRLAAEVAMGSAVMQAQALDSDAVQLLVTDGVVPDAGAAIWAQTGRRQRRLAASRTQTAGTALGVDGELAAMLWLSPASLDALDGLAKALAGGPMPQTAPRWTGEVVHVSYDTPAKAVAAVRAASAMVAAGGRVAAHYGIVRIAADPFGGPAFPAGPAAAILPDIAFGMPPGAVYVSEDFAAALAAASPEVFLTELVGELAGEVENPTRLFALLR